MNVSRIVVAIGLLLAAAGSARAQSVTLEFADGRVKLITQNASISQILSEWSRRGHTTIVNGERVPGPPATLELVDVPEQVALDIILRTASGYLVAERETPAPGASAIDRIYILPTSRVTNSTSALPTPAAQAAAQPLPAPIVDDDDDAPPPPPGQRVPPVNLPPGVRGPQPQRVEPNRPPPDEAEVARPVPPSNPFGVAPGSSQPGVITPVPNRNPQR